MALISNENELSQAQTASDLGSGYKGVFGVNLQKEIRKYLDSIQDGGTSSQEWRTSSGDSSKNKATLKSLGRNNLIK